MRIFQTIRSFQHLMNTQFYGTSMLNQLIQFEGLEMEVLIKIWNYPPKGDFCRFSFLIDKRILSKGTFSVMRITLSKIKKSLYTIDSTEARHQLK